MCGLPINRLRAPIATLSPRNFADEIERELALFGVAGHLDNEFVKTYGEIFLEASATLLQSTSDGEDIRCFERQQPDSALKIVPRMRGDDRLMVDIEVR